MEFLIPKWSWAETQLGAEPSPASRFLSFPLSLFRTAQHACCCGPIQPSGANLLHQPVSKDTPQ
jgi:hypothetical protein